MERLHGGDLAGDAAAARHVRGLMLRRVRIATVYAEQRAVDSDRREGERKDERGQPHAGQYDTAAEVNAIRFPSE